MFLTEISNHPDFATITRTIEMVEDKFDEIAQVYYTKNIVKHYLDGNHLTKMNCLVELVADNKATIETPEGPIGDYDYIVSQSEEGIAQKDIYAAVVEYCDLSGKINQKCNY